MTLVDLIRGSNDDRSCAEELGLATMNDSEFINLTARALAHFNNGTTDQAAAVMEIPLSAYTDENRFSHEREQVFLASPIAIGLSIEIPMPGSYVAREVMGLPLLLTRDADGDVHCFINICKHRGAQLCAHGRGNRTRFSCPYHAWTYDNRGELISIYAQETFGDVDRATRGLSEFPCAERCGVVFAVLQTGAQLDIDSWLGDMRPRLESLALHNWRIYLDRWIDGAGWKATMDGYLEVYHHNSVHGKTVGKHTVGNLLVHDTFGPHQRMVFARPDIKELNDRARSEWEPSKYTRYIHSIFPNLSISGILGDLCLVGFIYPGNRPDQTLTHQFVLCHRDADPASIDQQAEQFSQMTLQAVRDEDYALVRTVQAGMSSGANTSFLIGRNEPAVQHYHKMVEQLSQTGSHPA